MSALAHILVVDDEPLNLEIITEYLGELAYRLTSFESPLAAWAHLQAIDSPDYDLILLDRMMPGMDGIQLLKAIKAEARFRKIPVVMQTAASSPEEVAQGIAAGAMYYLAKPYSGRELRAIVESALVERVHWFVETAPDIAHGSVFEFASLEEARTLAARLASLCPEPQAAALGLAELFINAIEHGNLEISYSEKTSMRLAGNWESEIERRLLLPEYSARKVRVELEISETAMVFIISDCGQGFDWHPYMSIAPERVYDPNGRGIAIAHQLCFDHLEYRGCGNVVAARIATSGTELTQKSTS
jgi:CheY-like chemotaxis protein